MRLLCGRHRTRAKCSCSESSTPAGRDLAHLVNTALDPSRRRVGLRVLAGQRAQIDTTTAASPLVFAVSHELVSGVALGAPDRPFRAGSVVTFRTPARITCPLRRPLCFARRHERGNASGARKVQRVGAAVGRTHATPLGRGRSPRHWPRRNYTSCRGDRAVARHGAGRREGTGFSHAAGPAGGRCAGACPRRRSQGADGSRSGSGEGVGPPARPVHTGRPAGAAALDMQQRSTLGGAIGGSKSSGERAHDEPSASRIRL